HFMIPVEAISSTSDAKVQINHTLKHVINSPAYDPTLANQVRGTGLWQPYYDYYGYAPYWGGSVGYPL
ncbi:MAG: hypothetical protein ABI282_03685, partial [Candidatus Baltobacteraceae bacterium]